MRHLAIELVGGAPYSYYRAPETDGDPQQKKHEKKKVEFCNLFGFE